MRTRPSSNKPVTLARYITPERVHVASASSSARSACSARLLPHCFTSNRCCRTKNEEKKLFPPINQTKSLEGCFVCVRVHDDQTLNANSDITCCCCQQLNTRPRLVEQSSSRGIRGSARRTEPSSRGDWGPVPTDSKRLSVLNLNEHNCGSNCPRASSPSLLWLL